MKRIGTITAMLCLCFSIGAQAQDAASLGPLGRTVLETNLEKNLWFSSENPSMMSIRPITVYGEVSLDYDYQNGKSILKGYRAVRTVEVTVRQLDKLNSLLDGALKAGLNEIRSVSLGVAQPEKYKDEARKAAIDDAIHQAEQLASGFKSKLGPVYSVRYHVSNYQPSPMVRMMKADAAPVSAQETYEQPTIQFDDQVDVVFQLEPVAAQPKPAQ